MKSLSLSPSLFIDFNYDNTPATTFATAPSSPQSTIPFIWEQKPGIPKQNDTDFAFGYLQRHSISTADDLFDCGMIKPLKPPPRLHCSNNNSPISSKSPKLRFKEALSPKGKANDFDPFFEAFKQTPCEHTQRVREPTTKSNRYKVSRSLSPFRVSGIVNDKKKSSDRPPASGLTWYHKWNLKKLLLFRSGCDGSVTTIKDSMKKYTMLQKNETGSFRSKDRAGSMKVSGLTGCLRFHYNAGSAIKE